VGGNWIAAILNSEDDGFYKPQGYSIPSHGSLKDIPSQGGVLWLLRQMVKSAQSVALAG
jgi:hypothetical protein